jgi:hypothetical protein
MVNNSKDVDEIKQGFLLCRKGKLGAIKYGIYNKKTSDRNRDIILSQYYILSQPSRKVLHLILPNHYDYKPNQIFTLNEKQIEEFSSQAKSTLISKILNYYLTKQYGNPTGLNQFKIESDIKPEMNLVRSVQYTVNLNSMEDFTIVPILKHQCFIRFTSFLQFNDIQNKVLLAKQNGAFNAKITLHDESFTYNTIINVNDKWFLEKCKNFKTRFKLAWITPDYEVLAAWNPDKFGQFVNFTNLTAHQTILKIGKFLKFLPTMEEIIWDSVPYITFKPILCNTAKSLMFGNKGLASKLSAVFFNGYYKKIEHFRLNLMIIDHDKFWSKVIVDCIYKFLGPCADKIKIYYFDSDTIHQYIDKIEYSNQTLVICKYYIDKNLNKKIYLKTRFNRVGYMASPTLSNASIANFIAKMFVQFGGRIAILNEKPYWTISIDIGHNRKSNYSMLTVVVNGSDGSLYKQFQIQTALKENLEYQTFHTLLKKIRNYLDLHQLPVTENCLVLRDGKMHQGDTDHIINSFTNLFPNIQLTILAVKKSGNPYLFYINSKQYLNLPIGQCFINETTNEAFLTTNEQAIDKNQAAIPLGIQLEYGNKDYFYHYVEYIYWQCRLYQNNLYYCNKLPWGIALADELSYTGEK